ncbi:hypothetical protein NPIL_361401 [Nephila pilipes]|uniref:Uncharacterized protein n=1 Tax=Nephila pilipes TaxID=299642 RepID=A0A8X6NR59_NEPPI|nr:hypothetical protein NPIL_361401 [Nephila pilipes]
MTISKSSAFTVIGVDFTGPVCQIGERRWKILHSPWDYLQESSDFLLKRSNSKNSVSFERDQDKMEIFPRLTLAKADCCCPEFSSHKSIPRCSTQ